MVSMTQKMEKRIPVSQDTWNELGKMKEAGETYNDLLKEMIREYNRKKLLEKMKETEEKDEKELVSLDDV